MIGRFEYCSYSDNKSFPHYMESEENEEKFNPQFKPFKKIYYLDYQNYIHSETFELLSEVRYLGLEIKNICLNVNSSLEYEFVSYLDFLWNSINHIKIWTWNANALPEKFLNSINVIRPNRLTLMLREWWMGYFNIIKILTAIKCCLNLELYKYVKCTMFKLSFNNVPVLIQSDQEEPIFIKCKRFSCNIKVNEIDKHWHINEKSDDIKTNGSQFLIIKSSLYFQFDYFVLIENEEELNLLQNEFPISHSDNKLKLIILIEYLDSVDINDSQTVEILNHENRSNFIKLISKAQHISWSIRIKNLVQYIDQFTDLKNN